MLMMEGNWYATDFSMFANKPFDENMIWQFHKYWDEVSPRSLNGYKDLRRRTGLPLWLGETGENSPRWFAWMVQLMEQEKLGWCFWPYKRLNAGTLRVVGPPESWLKTAAVMAGGSAKDSMTTRQKVQGLRDLTEG